MEKKRKTPEEIYYKAENKLISKTLRGAMCDLAEQKGFDPDDRHPDTEFGTQNSYVDLATGINHSYVFHTAYNRDIKGFAYFLSHTEAVRHSFIELDTAIQEQLILQLQTLSENEDEDSGVDADYYLDAIRRLYTMEDENQNVKPGDMPEDIVSAVTYTEFIDTQYVTDEATGVITKKIVTQQRLDDNVLTEIEIGSHGDEAVAFPAATSFEEVAKLASTDMDISFTDIDDIATIEEYLYHLNLVGGKLVTPMAVDLRQA